MGGFDGSLAWIEVVCEQQLGYWVPGLAQCEVIIFVDIVLVESYLDGFTLSRAWNPVTKLLFTHNLNPG
jgi:hypothetical protein